eukprot:CAMPEP_0198209938 /NCGR_PEP_ID=MMETSP1445-20131203/17823_1 /TAXON_ID=36898 /ORGANISM="Pyramimonas sp., Strain CCMP2087" /LENGTH=284 /DNA_ID=CAMNT_0043883855 /DNA_START=172 /DNA_END=1022 /DNA_ORIENTATION=-
MAKPEQTKSKKRAAELPEVQVKPELPVVQLKSKKQKTAGPVPTGAAAKGKTVDKEKKKKATPPAQEELEEKRQTIEKKVTVEKKKVTKEKKETQEEKVSSAAHPFEWDPADDCETSLQAYKDIAPVLTKLAQKLGKPKAELRIYDPYYCQGAVPKHLNKLGFPLVYNKDEDFYAKLDAGELPPHDVLLTSPPYSATHVKKLLEHVGQSKVPWILLLPDYVHRKQYYTPAVGHHNPFFLLPTKSYQYMAVSGSRADNTNIPCRHFERSGECPAGDACMFLHSKGG